MSAIGIDADSRSAHPLAHLIQQHRQASREPVGAVLHCQPLLSGQWLQPAQTLLHAICSLCTFSGQRNLAIQNFSFLMQPRNPGIVSHLCCLWPCISPYATKAAAAAALSPRAMSTPLAVPACTPLRLGILLYRLKLASLRLKVLYVKLYTLEESLATTPGKIAPSSIQIGTRVEFYRQ